MRLIGDPGSTHNGDLTKARELVSIGADAGLDVIKFQLLRDDQCKSGNIMLPWEWLPELMELGNQKGVEVFASVFDKSGFDYVVKCGCKSIKYSYSNSSQFFTDPHIDPIENWYVSCDLMSPDFQLHPIAVKKVGPGAKRLIRLYCLPLYPVPYHVNFEGLFPRFEGFSSHCMGIHQEILAESWGAKYLEFHFQGGWHSGCPDGRFAKSPKMTAELCKKIRDAK